MDAINILNDPASDYHLMCPNCGPVDDDHDIDYCMNPE